MFSWWGGGVESEGNPDSESFSQLKMKTSMPAGRLSRVHLRCYLLD